MFYPEYVDMEMEYLGEIMELEMNKFLHEELPCHMSSAFSRMCKKFFSDAARRSASGCSCRLSLIIGSITLLITRDFIRAVS